MSRGGREKERVMPTIQQAIQRAASRFALEVVEILRAATLAEIAALTGKGAELLLPARPSPPARRAAEKARPGRPPRPPRRRRRGAGKRTVEEVARLADRVVEYLKAARGEVAVSTIAEGLKLHTAELALPLSRLRKTGRVRTRGQRRSMVYRLP